MSPGSRNAGGKSRRRSRMGTESEDDEYRKKRDRNNLAVKRSRVRSRMRTQETMARVQALKSENDQLEEKIKLLSKELTFLKELFLAHAGGASTHGVSPEDIDIDKLLQENDLDDDEQNDASDVNPSSL